MSTNHTMEVSINLKEQIKNRENITGQKISVKEIAEFVGVSEDYIRKIKNGKRTCSNVVLKSLADFFKCKVDDLILSKNKTLS